MKNKIYSNILHVLLCLFAFAIPFSTPYFPYINITPSIVAVLLLIWLIEGDFPAKWQRIKSNKLILPFALCTGLYFLYLLGLLYSNNLMFGLSDLGLKLPLLIFPVLIFTLNPVHWTKKKIEILLKLFVLGSLMTLIVSLIHSWMMYKETSILLYFFYVKASLFHHPSYASMYYCFSFVILVYLFLVNGYSLWEKIVAVIAIILFSVEILFLESRAGILTFGSILAVYIFYILFFKRKLFPYVFMGMIGICLLFVGTYKSFPEEWNRIQQSINDMKEYYGSEYHDLPDTYIRLLVWNESLKVGIENLPFGVGTGDIKDELMKQYQKDGCLQLYENNLNAHCQYLQLFASLGILGSLFFLFIVVSSIWASYKTRSLLFLLFCLITGINFLVESMLEKQAGVMFFVFFLTLLYFFSQTQLLKQKTDTD